MAWALYDRENFERIVNQITVIIDDLENLFPVEAICRRRLAEMEIEVAEDEQSLTALKDATDGTDNALLDAVVQKFQAIEGRNCFKDVDAEDCARVLRSNKVGEIVLTRGMAITDCVEDHGN